MPAGTTWTAARILRISEPAWPIVLLLVIFGLNKLFDVQSLAGAAAVGVGISAVIIAGVLLGGTRSKRYVGMPLLDPLMLPWGAAFVLVGNVMMRLEEPWNYWGSGVLVIGLINLVLGTIGRIKQLRTRSSRAAS